jgi:hypothetical protein
LRFIILVLAGHKEIALENAALRQQLTIGNSRVRNSVIAIDCSG